MTESAATPPSGRIAMTFISHSKVAMLVAKHHKANSVHSR
jgi:hypothetical protein